MNTHHNYSLVGRLSFDIEALVRRGASATTTREYNADLRRLLPGPGYADTKRPLTEFGAILVTIWVKEEVNVHRHDEEECFIVIAGRADLELEGQSTTLAAGDVVYIPRFWFHQLKNPYDQPFRFFDLYWDDHGRSFEEYERLQYEDVA